MPPEDPKKPEPESPPAPRPLWKAPWQAPRRLIAWAAAHRRKAILWGAVGLAVLAATAVVLGLALRRKPVEKGLALLAAWAALDSQDYSRARQLAESVPAQPKATPEEKAAALFILGVATAYEADLTRKEENTNRWLVAARYLKEAHDAGFPRGREGEGMFLYGKSLYHGGKIVDSRPVLLATLPLAPQHRAEIHYLVAATFLADANPKLKEALEENGRAQADRGGPDEFQGRVTIQRAQIQVALGQPAQCRETLGTLPPHEQSGVQAMLLRGQAQVEEARALAREPDRPDRAARIAKKYEQAINTLRRSLAGDNLATSVTRKALYLIGVCFLENGDPQAAAAQFERVHKLFPGTGEAIAAAYQGAELLRQSGAEAKALAIDCEMLRAMPEPADYVNPWMALDELRTRMITVYQRYLEAKDFSACLQLAEVFFPLLTRERTLELAAEAHRHRGRAILDQAEHAAPSKAEASRRQGRAEMRAAGNAYQRLARLSIAQRRYLDDLWNGVQAYLEGQDYRSAVLLLTEYLKNESRRHADAQVALGEALLALERYDEALKVFRECMQQHSRQAAAFGARLLAARAYTESGNFRRAETLLNENLQGELLAPDSPEWRQSLFDLGRLLHAGRRYEEAIARLEEAVARYPQAPQTLESQYLIADSYRQIAVTMQESLSQILVDSTRTVRAKQIRQAQATSLEHFQKLQEALDHRQELAELTPMEKIVLRNCDFAVGGLLFDLGRQDEAIKAYSVAANRARNTPEALEAYAQIASAYHRLDRPVEARMALEQAKALLAHLKSDTAFSETTNYTRQQWSDRLGAASRE
jgi:tetratricopeptide (TPR) repeat protein